MEYVNLGNSGLKVSRFCFGSYTNSFDPSEENQLEVNKMVKTCFEAGINVYDTAELYGLGLGEKILGKALKALDTSRHNYVVFTKLMHGVKFETSDDPIPYVNGNSCSRKHLMEGMNRSLENLGMDYVDVVYCHRYDSATTIREVCFAMKDIIKAGKSMYWGTSMWPAVRILEAMKICDEIQCPRPIVEQCIYNMYRRELIEDRYTILIDDYKLGTSIYSPLYYGFLTGKYNNGVPENSRMTSGNGVYFEQEYQMMFGDANKVKTVKQLNELSSIGERLGCTLPQLAIAWALASDDVSTVILGASRFSHLESNLAAYKVKALLTPEILEEIEGILQTRPTPPFDMRTFAPLAVRR